MAHDAQEHFGEPCYRGSAEFNVNRLQGYENTARKRAVEGSGGGPSETERRNGKQSRNGDSCPRCVDARKRNAQGGDQGHETEDVKKESFDTQASPKLGNGDVGGFLQHGGFGVREDDSSLHIISDG